MAAPIAAASPAAAAVNRSGRSGRRLSSAWRRTLRAGLRNLPAVASLACFVVVSSLLIIINKEASAPECCPAALGLRPLSAPSRRFAAAHPLCVWHRCSWTMGSAFPSHSPAWVSLYRRCQVGMPLTNQSLGTILLPPPPLAAPLTRAALTQSISSPHTGWPCSRSHPVCCLWCCEHQAPALPA